MPSNTDEYCILVVTKKLQKLQKLSNFGGFYPMEEVLKALQQVCAEVWKNYKHHAETYDSANPEEFWDAWSDDISVMDAAYRNDPVRYELYQLLAKGLVNATERGLNNGR